MSEKPQDTVLNSIADNLADSFFEGGASSNNVITPVAKEGEAQTEPTEPVKTEENLNTFNIDTSFKAEDLLGDRLEKDDKVIDIQNPTKTPVETVEDKSTIDFNFIVEEGLLAGFEDDTPIKTKEDLANLIKANKTAWEEEYRTKAIEEERSSLPEEVKFVIDYAKKGGDDLKTVFKLLGQTHEIREYDVTKPEDQKQIVRAYYDALGWSEDETEEEIISLHEGKRLQAAAEKFKPKLDGIKQHELEERKKAQEEIDTQRNKARQFFEENVINTLKGGKVGEVKLNKEEQLDLYNALVREQYQSFNGPTNRLGALLDRIQYVKPDYEHLMEVAMLLSNRDGFKKKIREQINTEVTAQQVKKIKSEQQAKNIGSAHNPEKEQKRLPKLGASFINPF